MEHKQRVLARLEREWLAFTQSYADLKESQLARGGVVGDWSIKDLIAHVTSWEKEALKYLPLIATGGTPPRYSTQYGGIDAFNAMLSERNSKLSLATVLKNQGHTHRRLLRYLENVPEEQFRGETRFRRRLREDGYGHYSKHAKAIREWRAGSAQ